MNDETTNTSTAWVDVARFSAAFLVVLAHIEGWGSGPYWALTFYYTISRLGVPTFFLISGYLLLSKQESLMDFFKKRAARILIPFLVWSILYDLLYSKPFEETGINIQGILEIFIRILRGPRAGHLWFIYSLVGLYFLTPVLRVFIARATSYELYYFIGLWFLAAPMLYILEGLTPIKIGFEIYYAGGYIGYFLIGYWLAKLEITPIVMYAAVAAFLAGFVFSFSVFYFDLPPLKNELPFRSYVSLNIVLMSMGAFILFRMVGQKAPTLLRQISGWGSKASFGIYLFHFMLFGFITLLWKQVGFDPAQGNSVFVIPLVAVLVFLISWVVVFCLAKIPVLRALV